MRRQTLWTTSKEWPKVDLTKHHLTHLGVTWTVPYSEEAAEQFAGLLDLDGTFHSPLSYTRGRIRHYRVESAEIGPEDDTPLLVSVQYLLDTDSIGAIPKDLEEEAWLLEILKEIAAEPVIRARADYRFPNSPSLKTAVDLPLDVVSTTDPPAFDTIFGVRGMKYGPGGASESEYTFTLEREQSGDVVVGLDFGVSLAAPEKVPDGAIQIADGIVERLVSHQRK